MFPWGYAICMHGFVAWRRMLEMLEKRKFKNSLTRSLHTRQAFEHKPSVLHCYCNIISFSKCNMMPSLLDMSPELLAQILENCESFPELFTLISVCKRLYSIWSLNTGSIIQAIGERSIAAFDDALMAVRVIFSFLTPRLHSN